MVKAQEGKHNFIKSALDEITERTERMKDIIKSNDIEVDKLPAATFDEMDIAVDNVKVYKFCKSLNEKMVSYTFSSIVRYAFDEMSVFGINGARLKPGHFKQFVELVLEVVDSRSYSVRVPLTDTARSNMELIQSKANSIDEQVCNDFNKYFESCHDANNPNFFDINMLINKYLNKEENDMNSNDGIKKYSVGDDACGDVEIPSEQNGCKCKCENHVDPNSEQSDGIEACTDCLAEYEGEGDVFHAPVINFNAPIIYMTDNVDKDVFEHVRDILLDFYNCNE